MSIVALGSFNPAIFHPLWFSGNDLIRPEEAESAEVDIVHRDIAIFRTEWFGLQVTGDRFAADTSDPTKYQPLADLVSGVFTVLEHCPIRAFGMNRQQDFEMPSEEKWHAFGDHFVPKDSWEALFDRPGMRVLVIQGKRDGCEAARVQAKLEPSPNVQPGVLVHVNQHYDAEVEGAGETAPDRAMAYFLEKLQQDWAPFLQYTQTVAQHLLTEYEGSTE